MNKQIAKLRFYIFILAFAFGIQLLFSILYCRHSNFLHSASFNNIDSLITEIGELKDENQQINEKVLLQIKEDELTKQMVFKISENLLADKSDDKNSNTKADEFEPENEVASQIEQDFQDYINQLNNEKIQLQHNLDQKNRELADISTSKEILNNITDVNKHVLVFLLLGQHEGLTDSIQLIFANTKSKKLTLVSIPRDLYHEGRKINEFLQKYGPEKLKTVIFDITGFKIDNYMSIDMEVFTDMINQLGGLDILVDKKLVDTRYPDGGTGYKTVTFEEGMERMNGERVLEYTRSRKSTSDFDRSLRQQKVLLAIRQKLAAKPIFDNVNLYIDIYNSINKTLKTDIGVFEAMHYFDQFKNYDITAGNILSNANFLYSSTSVSGQSILLPKNGSYSEFQKKLLEII